MHLINSAFLPGLLTRYGQKLHLKAYNPPILPYLYHNSPANVKNNLSFEWVAMRMRICCRIGGSVMVQSAGRYVFVQVPR